LAPEIIHLQKLKDEGTGRIFEEIIDENKADVFSFGVLLFITILKGLYPFQKK
jgi:serine/threonine protein kinase